MQRICKSSGKPFEITLEDLEFYKKISLRIGGQFCEIPPPTLCPDERQRRRLAWRNERKLYRRKCDCCHKPVVSIYHADVEFPVYCPECWWSDSWDSIEYGRDFDFQKPFFDQLKDLMAVVPRISLIASLNENSDFVNFSAHCKNCYLIWGWGDNDEDCSYGRVVLASKDCIDIEYCYSSELCYESMGLENCHTCLFCENCRQCSESYFLKNCSGCHNCFGCINLINQQYRIFNVQYSKTDYERELMKLLEEVRNHSKSRALQKKVQDFFKTFPRKFYTGFNNDNSSGDYLRDTKNSNFCFDVRDTQDVKFIVDGYQITDSQDLTVAGDYHAELSYECISYTGNHCLFGSTIWFSNDLIYTQENISKSSDCFGCVGLNHKQYSILNKQYTKEEYEVLIPKIIDHMQQTGEWGEFFPTWLSPFAYNETVAQEYYPMAKEEVLAKGWKWRDETNDIPSVEKTIPANLLPDSIIDIPDDILNWAITCEESGRPFIIQKSELEFYRKMNLPVPHFHPDIRHQNRMDKRNPRKLWQRNCDNCGKSIQTTYGPERLEQVFCEECYQKAVY